MVDLQTISLIVQIVGVSATATAAVVGVSSYINSNKRAEEAKRKEQETRNRELSTRQAQMFMNIYNQIMSKEFTVAHEKVVVERQFSSWGELRDAMNDREFIEAARIIGGFYEGLGVLVREGFLDIRLVALLISGSTIHYWEKFKPFVEEGRRALGYSRWNSETEYLYNELMRYLETHPELRTDAKMLR